MIVPIYHARIMQAYQERERYQKAVNNPHFSATQKNGSCGDELTLAGYIKNGHITGMCFTGTGCIISQAAAVMLIKALEGVSVAQAQSFSSDDMKKLFDVHVGPARDAFVLLALEAVHRALFAIKKHD